MPIGERPTVIGGNQLGKTRQLWVEQVTPVLMEMAQETRGDGVQRGVLILGPGQHQIQVTVTRVANEDLSKPVVAQVPAADLLQITPGDC
jgi:hypothetical protein